jgi:putative two-component system response regulator
MTRGRPTTPERTAARGGHAIHGEPTETDEPSVRGHLDEDPGRRIRVRREAPSPAAATLSALHAEWPATIVIADDDDGARAVLKRILERAGYTVLEAADGERARQLIASVAADLIVLDITMPGADGVEICREVKASPATNLTPVVHVTGSTDRDHRLAAIEAGSDEFVGKPFDIQELLTRVRSLLRTRRLTTQLVSAEAVMVALARTVEARDLYTERHLTRVAQRAVGVAMHVGVDRATLETVRLGGLLHDLGKIAVPDAILLKAGTLTRAEFELIKVHPAKGEEIVRPLTRFSAPGPVVLHHHEHVDGSGYPDALRGDAIPFAARIVSVADAFDAMTTTRPYRRALPVEVAFERLRAGRGSQWDGSIVDAFIQLYGSIPLDDVEGADGGTGDHDTATRGVGA